MSYTNNLKLFLEKRAGSYSIQLTPEEMDSLDYFAGRGYDCGLKAALQLENEEKTKNNNNGTVSHIRVFIVPNCL